MEEGAGEGKEEEGNKLQPSREDTPTIDKM